MTRFKVGTEDTGDPILLCPFCGEHFTRLEAVHVSARHEDGDFTEISVNPQSGEVSYPIIPGPIGRMVATGRRHRISLIGYCECCGGRFAIVLTQHKGVTYAEVVRVN